WDQVAQYLIDEGFQIIILGGKNDMAPDIENENIIDMRGKTTIQHCQEIISNTRLFISTDSGLFHIASTTETPIVGIFTCAAPTTRTTRLNNVSFVCPKNDVCRFQLTKGKDIVTFHKCKSVNKYECIKSIMPKDIIESIKNFKDIAND
ncbi:MAG: glycosyltransferase family 9 protein, partial [Thermoplasmatales archaeon]